MGARDWLAKALQLPPGATTQTPQQIIGSATGSEAVPLERDPYAGSVPFGPGIVLVPANINYGGDTDRPAPRRFEFPVSWNTQITPIKDVPFTLLRNVADSADLVRKCIEIVKETAAGWDWDIVPLPDAVNRVMAENPQLSTAAASRIARESLAEEITRCAAFWAMPDRVNGVTFPEWIAMALEEMLVIDALSIHPNRTMDDENLHSLIIIDGATVKPLLDDYGNRPVPPMPAFQQILYGFPRGEFTASADADGEFTADDLIYAPRTRRPFSPYGFSAVEQSLPMVDLYLKRVAWLRGEFTDGTLPAGFIKSDIQTAMSPEALRAYEGILNDDLAGQDAARHRMRLLKGGMDVIFPPNMDEKFKPDLDEFLAKQVGTHFGVMPSQLGFPAKGGLGGKGVQQGESDTADSISMKPTRKWLTDLLNQMSYRFLNMPKDLTFRLGVDDLEDELQTAQRDEILFKTGRRTLNDFRGEDGLPLYTFPEADLPFLENTLVPASDVQEQEANPQTEVTDPTRTEDEAGGGNMTEAGRELAAFARWSKGAKARPFEFTHVPGEQAHALNELVTVDPDAARDLANILRKRAKGGDARGRDRSATVGGRTDGRETHRGLYEADHRFVTPRRF